MRLSGVKNAALNRKLPVDRIRTVDASTAWSLWKKLWGFLGPIGNGLQWIYNINAKFHLAVKRAWYWVTNATAHWNASFEFDVPEGDADLSQILSDISDTLSQQQGFQIIRDTRESKVIRARGIVFDLNCLTDVLHIQVNDQTVSFRESEKIITRQLLPIIERVEQLLPRAKKHYALTARFGAEENPYLSVYLRRLDRSLITSFQCSYNLDNKGDDVTVSVNLDSVNVVAESRESFREASLKLLALSRP